MTKITPPSRSVFDTSPENLRPFLEGLAARVAAGSNWMVRKKTLCDLLLGLDAFFALPESERLALVDRAAAPDDTGAEGDTPAANAPEDDGPEDDGPEDGGADFREVLPIYVGAILEQLAEKSISSPEQAMIYMLSIHPEHHGAAEAWMLANPRHGKAVRKLIRTDRRYRQLMERLTPDDLDPDTAIA